MKLRLVRVMEQALILKAPAARATNTLSVHMHNALLDTKAEQGVVTIASFIGKNINYNDPENWHWCDYSPRWFHQSLDYSNFFITSITCNKITNRCAELKGESAHCPYGKKST